MSRYANVYVEVCLDEFDTIDLIEELESRGHIHDLSSSPSEKLESIYRKKVLGQDFDQELNELIYQELGRIV
jgi:hypothetical protein